MNPNWFSMTTHDTSDLHLLTITFWQDDSNNPPTVSKSGQPINYALPTDKPNIGYGAPSLTDVATGRKHKFSSTKTPTHKKKNSSSQSPTVASASQTDVLTNLPSSPSEGNFLNLLMIMFILALIVSSIVTTKTYPPIKLEERKRIPKTQLFVHLQLFRYLSASKCS